MDVRVKNDLISKCTPFVKRFKTQKSNYIYDVNTNRILRVDNLLFNLTGVVLNSNSLKNFVLLVEREIAGNYKEANYQLSFSCDENPLSIAEKYICLFSNLKKTLGVFSCNLPKKMNTYENHVNKLDYTCKVQQLILEVTQDCNLNCKYCSFGAHYAFTRKNVKRSMPFKIAKKAIDFYLLRTSSSDHHAVTFYGGEPLINYPLIKKSVVYIKERLKNLCLPFDVRFSFTTNGTLLDKEKITFLIKNDISILISLDGPEKCHDANRMFKNNKGTQRRIIENIKLIEKMDSSYYRDRVGFACVLGANISPKEVHSYYFKNELLTNKRLNVSFVSDVNSCYWQLNRPNKSWFEELLDLRFEYYDCLLSPGKDRDPFLNNLFYGNLLKIYKREIRKRLPDRINLNGCCSPGIRRLFIGCDGAMHMCERINNTVSIGHVEKGFDFNKIKKIVQDYKSACKTDCLNCWIVRFCGICFAAIVGDGSFDHVKKKKVCESERSAFYKSLIRYCELAEMNPAVFNFMEDIVVM